VHVRDAEPVVSPAAFPEPRPAPPAATGGVEKIVAAALAVMAAVLVVVYADQVRGEAALAPPPFDLSNPLLSAQPGQCIEVASADAPEHASWFVVRAPGVVVRPFRAGVRLANWTNPHWPDPTRFLPYLLCDARPAPSAKAAKGGALPPAREDPYVFPLNGFGLPLESLGVLFDVSPMSITWEGQPRKAFAVGLRRYDQMGGPWVVYLCKDAPVLGTMRRKYVPKPGVEQLQTFRTPDPETCR
jgi:hypothetical protein